ncbi:MAG: hypothetical protein KDA80_00450, partial [Planctomycetaceae bacterium]|nr:hypothetical protein [Planctomycetaceae bacterium]
MTTLRFTGEIPFWLGLLMAVIVGVLSWRYYNRERFDLSRRLRWLLPLLRSSAFFLGVMLLTGPVLHHRQTIGELGKVRIYVDASNSMTMQDRHLPLGRKIAIAESLGWLPVNSVDRGNLQIAEELAEAQRRFETGLQTDDSEDPNDLRAVAEDFLDDLQSIASRMPTALTGAFRSRLIEPLTALAMEPAPDRSQLSKLIPIVEELEQDLFRDFEAIVQERLSAGDQSLQSALTLFDETSRWRRAVLSLSDSPDNLLEELRERHDVSLFQLQGADASPWDLTLTETNSPLEFSSSTDLSSGLTASRFAPGQLEMGETDSQANAAIILISDGQHNSGPSPIQTVRFLGGQGVPVYCISTGALEPAPDLAVTSIEHPSLVFAKDQVRGTMTIKDSVKPGIPFVAQIAHGDTVLWQQELATENLAERQLEFEFGLESLMDQLGTQFETDLDRHVLPINLTASLSPLAMESELKNNERPLRLAAILKSDKVLILDGRPRWETRYLRNAFERDEQWRVNTILAGVGSEQSSIPRGDSDGQFPADRETLFDYNLIIFGEVDPQLLEEHELRWLREFVEIRGGGIIFIDGQRGRLANLPSETLGSLLPVEWLSQETPTKPRSLRLTDRGSGLAALRLISDEQENRQFWMTLPTPHRAVSVSALPDTETLAEIDLNGNWQPVIVTRQFGSGRVLYFASDETWRWRYKSADVWHQRFWNQIAKYVMPRPFTLSDEYVSIDTGSVSYGVGDSVDIRVRLLGLDGKPARDASVDALFWRNGELSATLSLTGDSRVPGQYSGRSAPLSEGDYEVSIRAAGYSAAALKARTEFVVTAPESGEMTETAANEPLLRQMASASNGGYLREEELG